MKSLILSVVFGVLTILNAQASSIGVIDFGEGKRMVVIGEDGRLYAKPAGDAQWAALEAQLPGGVKAVELMADKSNSAFGDSMTVLYAIGEDSNLYAYTGGMDGFTKRKLALPDGIKTLAARGRSMYQWH